MSQDTTPSSRRLRACEQHGPDREHTAARAVALVDCLRSEAQPDGAALRVIVASLENVHMIRSAVRVLDTLVWPSQPASSFPLGNTCIPRVAKIKSIINIVVIIVAVIWLLRALGVLGSSQNMRMRYREPHTRLG